MSDHIPTLADVCSAIAEGRLVAASDGSMYQVSAFELRRHFNKRHALPTISFLEEMLSSACSDTRDSTHLDLCSFGR
ncbi:hypothetical protein [Dictyobacter kobayashii]|uniref:Uncharacterized protein n=1 Tax=Dictyobacter kobayashii TaxID=2014872 RepID=A0A402ANR5_9CHLR|nr:hypothetical protein [Dictyobacter kobayashii]GCE20669.1 hypothetical protein KDK_44690 [Dictyobacter kobayashii]